MLAAASNAIVVGFNTKITETARRAAEAEGVDVRLYDIIYKLTDDIEAALKGLLEPEVVEVVEGRAEVRQIFRVGKSTVIAGSFVTDGRIVRGGARVWRGGKVIATDRIDSLRRFRDDVREVAPGFECGIGLADFHDLEEGDIIECFTTQTRQPGRGGLDRPLRLDRPLEPGEPADDGSTSSSAQEIGAILAREVADPRIGFVTITDVETTPDLRHAKVWVSVIGRRPSATRPSRRCGRAMPFVRHELGHAAAHPAHPGAPRPAR